VSREAAVMLARKLKALAEHDRTLEAEATSAKTKLDALVTKWEIASDELVEPTVPGVAPMDPAWQEWTQKAQGVIQGDGRLDMAGLRDLVDEMPDPEMRQKARMMVGAAQIALGLWDLWRK